MAALRSFAAREDAEGRAVLAPLAVDPEPSVRALAVATLREPEAILRALNDPASEVRAAAATALVRVQGAEGAFRAIAPRMVAAAGRERLFLAETWLLAASP